jgi:hypothetical protein
MERRYFKNYGIVEVIVTLIVFGKLCEIGFADEKPVAYQGNGEVAEIEGGAELLLMQDKGYPDTEQLPAYVLDSPVIVVRHSPDQSQFDMVKRYLEQKRRPSAISNSKRFSHIRSDPFFTSLGDIVSASDAAQRKPRLHALLRQFQEDHYTQIMDEYAALLFLWDISERDDSLRVQINGIMELIPEEWRIQEATVEVMYEKMMQHLA